MFNGKGSQLQIILHKFENSKILPARNRTQASIFPGWHSSHKAICPNNPTTINVIYVKQQHREIGSLSSELTAPFY